MSKKIAKHSQPAEFTLKLDGLESSSSRRVYVAWLLVWVPPLLLSLTYGTAYSGVNIPFLLDIDTYARLIVALAIFIAAEGIVDRLTNEIVGQFTKRGIISEVAKPRFDSIIRSASNLRNSVVAEFIIIAFVSTVGHLIWRKYTAFNVETWYATPTDGQVNLTPAGIWNIFISMPIFQFIVMRWYFRFIIWYRFLWQVSRLPLHLNSLHPDHAGGLGFLAKSVFAFSPVLIAHTVLLAGLIANRIFHGGATLPEFKLEIISVIAFLILIVIIPLFFFLLPLAKSKRIGTLEYGVVACKYVNDFKRKWIHDNKANGTEFLGTSDIQSLADLANSYDITRKMRITPFSMSTLIGLTILIATPLIPLVLTMIPIEKMIERAISILL